MDVLLVPECKVVQLVVHDEGAAAPAHDRCNLRRVLILLGLLTLLSCALGDGVSKEEVQEEVAKGPVMNDVRKISP